LARAARAEHDALVRKTTLLGLLFVPAALALVACSNASTKSAPTSSPLETSHAVDAPAAHKSAPDDVKPAAALPKQDSGKTVAAMETSGPPAGMSAIPAGFFRMGSPRLLGNPEERPMHERVVASFYMDQTEVTLGAYHKCVEAGKCEAAHKEQVFCTEGEKDALDHPVNCISHVDATSYCSFAGKRLPTEAEWEYAAQGGSDERRFSWGNDDPTQKTACFDRPGTCKVASFPAGAFGLYDMSGNVWEWTDSWFSYFGTEPNEPASGSEKVFKGGSFSRRWPKWLRVKNRSHWPREQFNSWLGFRCAETKLPLECPEGATAEGDQCKRSTGSPLCEPNMGWNGQACTPLGADGKPTAGDGKLPVDHTGDAGKSDDSITMSRTPGNDGDCQKNYPHKPHAYNWAGNTWEARIALVAAKGCTRRDNTPTSVSACCPD
jgi:formylglycine-generating enzyme required for sulfatase activity